MAQVALIAVLDEKPEPREEPESLRGVSDLETYHAHCKVCADYLGRRKP
jgi:hypothetical protein